MSSPDILSVSQLNASVARSLSEAYGSVWVRGEVSNFTPAASGHWYFTLKDAGAAVRAVMFRSRAQVVGFVPRAGDKIEIRARVSLYEPRGDYQLQVDDMRRAGLGDLYERFMRLKQALQDEGLFDPARKREVPARPRAIGVVTSRQAAALRDVLSALARRAPHVPVIIYPAPVQGPAAAPALARALAVAGERAEVDVILLVRGGGSIEDLWSFNEEVLARAVDASPIPVISGVGHETDFTIADFVADVRAPTPTAAAEMACVPRIELLERVARESAAMTRAHTRTAQRLAQQLDLAGARLISPSERLLQRRRHLAGVLARLTRVAPASVAGARHTLRLAMSALAHRRPDLMARRSHLSYEQRRLSGAAIRLLSARRHHVEVLGAQLAAQDPAQPLTRGFALVRDAQGGIVRDVAALAPQQRLTLSLARGQAVVEVVSTES